MAADIEKVCGESFDGLSKRIGVLEINEAEDAKQLAALGDQIAGLDKLVVRSNRDTQLVAQSLSEVRRRVARSAGLLGTALPCAFACTYIHFCICVAGYVRLGFCVQLKHQISGLDGRVALFSQGGGAKLPLNARNQVRFKLVPKMSMQFEQTRRRVFVAEFGTNDFPLCRNCRSHSN